MPIWEAVALGLHFGKGSADPGGVPLINNSYNCYVGSVLAFYIGEGRVTSIFGGETKLVFDWESVFFNLLSWGKDNPASVLGRSRRLMGGGDTTLVLGPTNKLNYYGADAAVNRARTTFSMQYWNTATSAPKISAPEGEVDGSADQKERKKKNDENQKKQDEGAKKGDVPLVIKCILALGFIGILATALLLRYWWDFSGISSGTVENRKESLASVLIPLFEDLWLSLLYLVELVDGGVEGLTMVLQVFGKGLGYTGAGIGLAVISPIAIANVISLAACAAVVMIPVTIYECSQMAAASLIGGGESAANAATGAVAVLVNLFTQGE